MAGVSSDVEVQTSEGVKEMRSKRFRRILPGLAATVCLAAAALAIQPPPARGAEPKAREVGELVKVQATVTAVNLKDRLVTLKGPQRELTVQVDPSVKNLEKVKVGDKVVVGYYESLALAIKEPGT